MALQELRQTRHLAQQELATILEVNQAALSKMENQADMRISTLRKILSAMGGNLKIVAEFPEGRVTSLQRCQKLRRLRRPGDQRAGEGAQQDHGGCADCQCDADGA